MGRLTEALRAADQELWLHIDIKNKVRTLTIVGDDRLLM